MCFILITIYVSCYGIMTVIVAFLVTIFIYVCSNVCLYMSVLPDIRGRVIFFRCLFCFHVFFLLLSIHGQCFPVFPVTDTPFIFPINSLSLSLLWDPPSSCLLTVFFEVSVISLIRGRVRLMEYNGVIMEGGEW